MIRRPFRSAASLSCRLVESTMPMATVRRTQVRVTRETASAASAPPEAAPRPHPQRP